MEGEGYASNPREEGGVLDQETKILGLYIIGLACKKIKLERLRKSSFPSFNPNWIGGRGLSSCA